MEILYNPGIGCVKVFQKITERKRGSAYRNLGVETIQSQRFYSDQYKTFGRWVCGDHSVATMFYYDGKRYLLPFRAVFTWATLPGLKAAAVLQMEAQIEERLTDDLESW